MAIQTRKDLNDAIKAQQDKNDEAIKKIQPGVQYSSDGFSLPATYNADGNGLPYSKVQDNRDAGFKRNIIHWFIPEFGVIKMYVNPQNITYSDKKIIKNTRTKGGYTLQYWGEELTTLSIEGNTGSSGIEGINVLYEIYRAEQLAFDSMGLQFDANNFSSTTNAVNDIATSIFGDNSFLAAGVTDVLGADSPNNSLTAKNIPSLAQLAFTVEMYYDGVAYRGYFEDFSFQEKASDFLLSYNIHFKVTQKRGYRTNYFPFHRSPKGPSEYTSPNSFSGYIKPNQ